MASKKRRQHLDWTLTRKGTVVATAEHKGKQCRVIRDGEDNYRAEVRLEPAGITQLSKRSIRTLREAQQYLEQSVRLLAPIDLAMEAL